MIKSGVLPRIIPSQNIASNLNGYCQLNLNNMLQNEHLMTTAAVIPTAVLPNTRVIHNNSHNSNNSNAIKKKEMIDSGNHGRKIHLMQSPTTDHITTTHSIGNIQSNSAGYMSQCDYSHSHSHSAMVLV